MLSLVMVRLERMNSYRKAPYHYSKRMKGYMYLMICGHGNGTEKKGRELLIGIWRKKADI